MGFMMEQKMILNQFEGKTKKELIDMLNASIKNCDPELEDMNYIFEDLIEKANKMSDDEFAALLASRPLEEFF